MELRAAALFIFFPGYPTHRWLSAIRRRLRSRPPAAAAQVSPSCSARQEAWWVLPRRLVSTRWEIATRSTPPSLLGSPAGRTQHGASRFSDPRDAYALIPGPPD